MKRFFAVIFSIALIASIFGTAGTAFAVSVKGYYKSNGTYVQPYERSAPKSVKSTSTISSKNVYYKNVDGISVHRPMYSLSGIPSGATAQCNDGTYSFSLHHRGTCTGHKGVSEWLK